MCLPELVVLLDHLVCEVLHALGLLGFLLRTLAGLEHHNSMLASGYTKYNSMLSSGYTKYRTPHQYALIRLYKI
jgi:hypothetical protein